MTTMTRLIDPTQLVGQTEIAREAQVLPTVVANLRTRHASFPQPVVTVSCGSLWDRREVFAWFVKMGYRNA